MEDTKLKFLFLGIVLALALIGRSDSESKAKNIIQENIKDTSLTAILKSQENKIFLSKTAEISQNLGAFFENASLYRRNPDIPDPDLQVKAAIALDLESNFNFYSLNPENRWALASLTKLMASVIALEEIGKDNIAVISKFAVDSEGTAGNLKADEEYSINDLIKAMLMVSSNDAATAIAEFYGVQDFVMKMQQKADLLEMKQTVFFDPTGISFLNQGTIHDLEKLVKYIYKNHPEIFSATKKQKDGILELEKGIQKGLININNFASREDFLGGKTGFTDQAEGNLISLFKYKGRTILLIVLGTDNRFGQTDLLYNWIKKAYTFN